MENVKRLAEESEFPAIRELSKRLLRLNEGMIIVQPETLERLREYADGKEFDEAINELLDCAEVK